MVITLSCCVKEIIGISVSPNFLHKLKYRARPAAKLDF